MNDWLPPGINLTRGSVNAFNDKISSKPFFPYWWLVPGVNIALKPLFIGYLLAYGIEYDIPAVKSDNENEHNFEESPIGSSYVGPYNPTTKQQILYK